MEQEQTKDFDLAEVRRKFPLTVANLAHLPNREAWLGRVWEIERRWEQSCDGDGISNGSAVLSDGIVPENLKAEADFEIVYAGGGLGLLHAAVMAKKHGRRVLVFDAHTVGKTHRDWNISDAELREFVKAGLFAPEEIERAVVNRYRAGFVKFYDTNSRIKTPPLWMENVLDVALDADKILGLALEKIKQTGAQVINNLRFIRAHRRKNAVLIETEDAKTGRRLTFSARLFVDATGTNSPLSRELNDNLSITHVCPTVGTVAKGFSRGTEQREVDFSVGEILVSTEDASDDRQLIWEGFAGSPKRDEYTTYLFFYDAVDSKADKSLFRLFEDYFEKLPAYKTKSKSWRVAKPVFGYIPSYHHHGWNNQKRTATDRILLVGDSAGLSSPLTFCGFGSHVRNLRRLTDLTEEALKSDALDAASLGAVNAYEPRVAQMASLAEFMRPAEGTKSSAVNETMNAVMAALQSLDENIRRELFQDRISFASFKKVLTRTAAIHPQVFKKMFRHLGAKGSFWWVANIAESALSEKKTGRNGNDK